VFEKYSDKMLSRSES
jgi:hypothetical protein